MQVVASPMWFVALKPDHFRSLERSWPSPAIGGFVKNVCERPIHFLFVSAEELTTQGIAWKDLAAYLETPSGSKGLPKCGALDLKPGCCAWLPFGLLPVPLGVGAGCDDNFFALWQPCFSIPMGKAWPEKVRIAAMALSSETLKTQASRRPQWVHASKSFHEFFEKINAE